MDGATRAIERSGVSRAVNMWVVQVGEPIVGVDDGVRSGRANLLCDALVERGHEVMWWNSTFDHFRKAYRRRQSCALPLKPGLTLRMLHGKPSYRRNTSVRRLLNQRSLARRFREAAPRCDRPDLIFACLPTPEICEQAVQFGAAHGIPVIVDIRDPWPDLYVRALPKVLRPLSSAILAPEYRRLRRIVRGARGITAVSESYLRWALGHAARNEQDADGVFPIGSSTSAGVTRQADGELSQFARTHGIDRSGPVVSFCGVFGDTYDLSTVIECARRFERSQSVTAQFVLAGTGDRLPELRRHAGANVVFTGWLDKASIAMLLRVSTLGLCAYARGAMQSLPNKPFEYMAAGLPQVSSLPGELEALIRDHRIGRQYVAGDAASLTEAIGLLLEDSAERERMSDRARVLFAERFDAARIYPRFAAHLERHASPPWSIVAPADVTY